MRRIAIFRALVLGDLLSAVPAWRAIRRAWPEAEISLIGLPWARELADRLDCIDRFIEFPGFPALPERVPDLTALPAFLSRMQAERFDLLLQMQGSGSVVNPLMASFGARRVAGFVSDGCWCADPSSHAEWPRQGHEIERMLALTDHLGLARQGLELDFPIDDGDRRSVADTCPELGHGPFVVLHVGAQLPSRRWPVDRFAAVARALQADGHRIVLTGTAAERPLIDRLRALIGTQLGGLPVIDLAGRTTLWTLGAVVEQARLVISNDTGISHVAAALGTRSVVISSGADVLRWAPLDRRRHRVLWQPMPCRPCGFADCPTGHECATAVTTAQVMREVAEVLGARESVPGPRVASLPAIRAVCRQTREPAA